MAPRWIVALVVLAAIVGGVAGSVVTLLLRDDNSAHVRGTLVHLGPPDYIAGYTPQPFCVPLHHFCIADPETGHPIALYTYDPHPIFREQGCDVRWDPDAQTETESGTKLRGLFVGPCSGSKFDETGHRLFGPSPRDLDQFRVAVTEAATIVDTRELMCGKQAGREIHDCQRAPLGD